MKKLTTMFPLAALVLQAWAQTSESESLSTNPFQKENWRVAAFSCPRGCSASTRNFLGSMVGKPVVLGEDKFEAPFVERCEGKIRFVLRRTPAQAVIDELNQGAASGHSRMKPEDLNLGHGENTSAVALCRTESGEASYQRLLLIDSHRVLVLFEEQSVLELR